MRRSIIVLTVALSLLLLTGASASAAALQQATITPTYTPIATRTHATVTPWAEGPVAVDVAGTPVALGTLSYSATAGDLLVAFILTAVLLLLLTGGIWLYRNRA